MLYDNIDKESLKKEKNKYLLICIICLVLTICIGVGLYFLGKMVSKLLLIIIGTILLTSTLSFTYYIFINHISKINHLLKKIAVLYEAEENIIQGDILMMESPYTINEKEICCLISVFTLDNEVKKLYFDEEYFKNDFKTNKKYILKTRLNYIVEYEAINHE